MKLKPLLTLLDGSWYPCIPSICECDEYCNSIVYNGKRFVPGHNTKTRENRKKSSELHKGQISPMKGKSSLMKGIPRPPDVCKRIGDAQRGELNHMFGKTTSQKQKDILTERNLTDNPMYRPEAKGMFAKELNPNWRGGISTSPYCPKWTPRLRKLVRERDSYICHLCGKTQIQERRLMSVHHIHYDKENCFQI